MRTVLVQPAVFVASVIRARRIVTSASVVVGHSLGEVTALVAAGALAEADGLEVAYRRGQICDEVARQHPGKMLGILGLELADVEQIRQAAMSTTEDVVEVAAINAPGQVVLSGGARAVDEVGKLVRRSGGFAVLLPIGGAFHCSLMSDACDPLERALSDIPLGAPSVRWLSTTSCREHIDPPEIRQRLIEALVLPVRWTDAVDRLSVMGDYVMVDVGPGAVLAELQDGKGAVPAMSLEAWSA
jgi:[acyl-carrier-protein] S-malonyltransferase